MDEKTAELRDIFMSVSDEEAVTESQEEGRGSLAADGSAETRLRETIGKMREKFGFEADVSDSRRCRLVEQFYDGASDEEIADTLELDVRTVFDARLELHLVRDGEPDLDPGTVEVIRDRPEADASEIAEMTDVTADEVRSCRSVLAARDRSRRVSNRFRTAFEEILTDVELTDQLAADVHDDGLADATDGAETGVDL